MTNQTTSTNIDIEAAVNHLAGNAKTQFEEKRNERECNKLFDRLGQIASEPVYKWED